MGLSDFNDVHKLYGLEMVKSYESKTERPVVTNGVDLIRATDIRPQGIDWIWREHLASGKLHLIAGMAGTGKTTIALSLAATLTTAGTWPDDTQCRWSKNVLIWSGEDDIDDTLLPRLLANGANTDRIFFISGKKDGEKRPFDPASDMPGLLEKAKKLGNVGLIVVDPIISAVRGDSNKNGDVRQGLQPIVDMALELKCAVLGVTHLSKGGEGRNPLERVTGSLAFGAVARIVFGTAKNTDEGDNQASYTFMRIKSNISQTGDGFYYDFEQSVVPGHSHINASKIVWRGKAEGSPGQLMANDKEALKDERSKRQEAIDFILAELANENVSAADMIKNAAKVGIKEKTLLRAKHDLNIKSVRRLDSWLWLSPIIRGQEGQEEQGRKFGHLGRLAQHGHVISQDGHTKNVTTLTAFNKIEAELNSSVSNIEIDNASTVTEVSEEAAKVCTHELLAEKNIRQARESLKLAASQTKFGKDKAAWSLSQITPEAIPLNSQVEELECWEI